MNEPIQAQEQKKQPTQDEQIDFTLEAMKKIPTALTPDVLEFLNNYIDLKRRQAAKARNQRQALRSLNKAHRASVLENRWLREAIQGDGPLGLRNWAVVIQRAKESLWMMFKKEQATTDLQPQIDKLAAFILEHVPGEPSRSEGAVDTAIRVIKEAQRLLEHPAHEVVRQTGEFLKSKGLMEEFVAYAMKAQAEKDGPG